MGSKNQIFISHKVIIGALTSKPYAFSIRPWELKVIETFDPTIEYFVPVNLNISDNKVRRVLPINNSNSNILSNLDPSYNWISNKTRFFFESFSLCEPSFNSFSEAGFSFFNKLAVKISNPLTLFKCHTYLEKGYLDLYSSSNLKRFTSFFSQSQVSSSFSVESKSVYNTLYKYFKLLFYRFQENIGNIPIISNDTKEVFLIGFNPYFTDPYLNFELVSKAQSGRLSIYTLFSKFSFQSRFYCKSKISSFKNLQSFFLGRNNWSRIFNSSSSIVVLDYYFPLSLPYKLIISVIQFINSFSTNVHILNLDSPCSSVSFPSSDVSHFRSNRFRNSVVIFNRNNMSNEYTLGNLKEFFISPNVSSKNDYFRLFGFNKLEFSSSTGFVITNSSINYYHFPTSPFLEFTGLYKNSKFVIPRISSSSIKPYKLNKPLSIFFNFFLKRINNSLFNSSFWVYDSTVFFLYILVLLKIPIFKCSITYFSNNNSLAKIPTVRNFFSYATSKNFFYYQQANFLYTNFVEFYKKEGFFYNATGVGSFSIFKILPVYFRNYYSNSSISYINDVVVNSSRTLSLDRIQRIKKFINFRRKLIILKENY